MDKVNRSQILGIVFILNLVLNLSLILDLLLFNLKSWPYKDGAGTETIILQNSLFFEQFASHCLYLQLNDFGSFVLLIIPFLSIYGVKNYLFAPNSTITIPRVLEHRLIQTLVILTV